MARGELEFIEWLTRHVQADACQVALGIGDDMSIVDCGGHLVLTTCDLLADGVHFDIHADSPADIGHKCIACSLSDCAAMAVKPLSTTVSVALPRGMAHDRLEQLFEGMTRTAREFNCPIVGGDTVAWDKPLVIDVTINAIPYPGITPVRRSGARVGDRLYVTGLLGGSLLGKHLTFTPRVSEARALADRLGADLHALMDISDGLALDLHRMCQASGVGARLAESRLQQVISPAAEQASRQDGRPPLEHVLGDGEDFELLVCVAGTRAAAAAEPPDPHLLPVGVVTEAGLVIETADGCLQPLRPEGYQHRL
ncbi:MAG: thiamine-monophosphate kinase [Phycisphaerae bacterium]|nr:thiamine-monophosphate kinase [Phycisphaerae bacterium]